MARHVSEGGSLFSKRFNINSNKNLSSVGSKNQTNKNMHNIAKQKTEAQRHGLNQTQTKGDRTIGQWDTGDTEQEKGKMRFQNKTGNTGHYKTLLEESLDTLHR